MKKMILFGLVTLGLASAAMLTHAQTRSVEPRLFMGDDIAFRVEGIDAKGKPTGRLVVRINGMWVEVNATESGGVRPAK